MTVFAAIQITTSGAIGPNLIQAKEKMHKAVMDTDAKCLVLPEHFACFPALGKDFSSFAEVDGDGRIQDFLSETAKYCNAWIVGGSVPIKADSDSNVIRNACLVYNNEGKRVARYDKIHMHDVDMPEAGITFVESEIFEPGEDVVVFDSPFGKIGLALCYDLRFPELFRALRAKGAEIICMPSAFLHAPGKVHWHVLIGARAIENQVAMVAANQFGVGDSHFDFHGNSMVVGPWGMIMDRIEEGVGYAAAEVDLIRIEILREEFPVWSHRKLKGDSD